MSKLTNILLAEDDDNLGLLLFNCKSLDLNQSLWELKTNMQNDEGRIVDLYIPRKCSATNRLITAKDHASVQIEIAQVRLRSPLTYLRLGWRKRQDDRHQEHYHRTRWLHAPKRWGRRLPQQTVRWQGPH